MEVYVITMYELEPYSYINDTIGVASTPEKALKLIRKYYGYDLESLTLQRDVRDSGVYAEYIASVKDQLYDDIIYINYYTLDEI